MRGPSRQLVPARTRRGVTLVETLAALALVAITLPVLARAWIITMDCAARSRAQVVSTTLAQNKLADLVAAGDQADDAESGDFGNDYPGYRWQVDTSSWPLDDRFRQINVTVKWNRRNMDYETTLSTLVSGE